MCKVAFVRELLYVDDARNAMDAESWCTMLYIFLSLASLLIISLLQAHEVSTPRIGIERSIFKSITLMW